MFTHLHVHTEYSLLDGISRIPALVKEAASQGMDALAITDHGSLYGAVDFYSEALAAGVKPIIGCEVYEAKEHRRTKDPSEKSPAHLTVLAQSNAGYKNLIQLGTKAHLEGFYYRPRVDDELLELHNEGLVVMSGCPSAKIPRLIAEGRMDEAAKRAGWYKELFDDRFYLEVQEHQGVPDLPAINKGLVELGRRLDLPLVATNDSHYTAKSDAHFQDLRICISTNSNVNDENRLKMDDDSFYLKSPEEMFDLFRELPEALANTRRISEQCEVKLNFGELHLPRYTVPDGSTAEEMLARLCWEGLQRLYGDADEAVKSRLEYELEVIRQTQFANYFLVVWDIVAFARGQGILLGVRGSAAASLALYCLGVTELDPLEHKLVFERFLNVERKEMPDIDMDFQDDRRDQVLRYVTQRYGKDKVAQIITFGTMGPKAAIRDVGRALGLTYSDTDRIARLIPLKVRTLDEAMASTPEIREIYESDQVMRDLIDNAKGLERIAHHVSTHAAGVVISEEPLTEYVPLQRPARGDESSELAMTQFAMAPIAKLGLLKMDFLGLTNLTILDKTLKVLEDSRGLKLVLSQIPLDDAKTFALLSSGETNEVFQLESGGMQRNIKELKPSSLGDVAAMIALYRPGPMEQIPTFIDAKHGRKPMRSPHPSLDEILKDTYGVIVYQDQVLLILQTFAGYSLGEADIVRKAMGKKIAELMSTEREKFTQGAVGKGFSPELAEEVFNLIEPFAGYAFNKAHSVSYGLISYWNAYFKANYALEYMASVLNARRDKPEKMAAAVHECLRMGIPVLAPDVNRSGVEFGIDRDAGGSLGIRFGLAAIKNLGENAVATVVESRKEKGAYESLSDFARRADFRGINRRVMESLVKAGALDTLGPRGPMVAAIDSILAQAQQAARMRDTGQTSLFQGHANGTVDRTTEIRLSGEDASTAEKVAWEKELLGTALSSSPLKAITATAPDNAITMLDQLNNEMEGQRVSLFGQISSAQERTTKNGRPYLNASIELVGGTAEVLAWQETLERTRDLWNEGDFLLVEGKVVVRGDELSIYCDNVRPQSELGAPATKHAPEQSNGWTAPAPANRMEPPAGHNQGQARTIVLKLEESDNEEVDKDLLKDVLEAMLEYPGRDRVHLEILTQGRRVRMDMAISIGLCVELEYKLGAMLGQDRVSVTAGTNGNGNGKANGAY